MDYIKEGLSLADIAKKREMAVGTIEGHLAKAVGSGQVDIYSFMSHDAVDEILAAYPEKVIEYKAGKKGLLGLFMGEIMKKTKGKADPKLTSELLNKKLLN